MRRRHRHLDVHLRYQPNWMRVSSVRIFLVSFLFFGIFFATFAVNTWLGTLFIPYFLWVRSMKLWDGTLSK